MVRVNICGLLWLSKCWGYTKCVMHRVGADFARPRKARQPPSVTRVDK